MKITTNIDEQLLSQAMWLTKARSRREVLEAGLRHLLTDLQRKKFVKDFSRFQLIPMLKTNNLVAFVVVLGCSMASPLALRAVEPEADVVGFRERIVITNERDVSVVVSLAGPIEIEGRVRDAAVAVGGDVIVRQTGIIEGDVTAIGGQVIQEPGSFVRGKITSIPFSIERLSKSAALAIPTLGAALSIVVGATIVLGSLGSIALAVLTLVLFPRQVGLVRREIQLHPFLTPAAGFAVTLVSLPVLIFLAITLIGLPLAFLVASALMAAIVLGAIALGQWLGHRIGAVFGRTMRPMVASLLGLVVLTVLSATPYIGVVAQGLIVCYSLGAPVCARYRAARALTKDSFPPPPTTTAVLSSKDIQREV
jgi:hypothetical protein